MDRKTELADSWRKNARNWTRAVRERLIPSRAAGTDAAIIDAVADRHPKRLLDVGCGEGFHLRALARRTGCTGVGIDGSPDLIDAARRADPKNDYRLLTYDELIADPEATGGPFDVILFNYALFEEDVVPLLSAARSLLAPGGAIMIQTLHPDNDPGDGADGWRQEDFAAFENENWTPMPWYFRTTDRWVEAARTAGLTLTVAGEPSAEPGGPPLSILFLCTSTNTGATDNP